MASSKVVALVLLGSVGAWGQSIGSSSLTGTILDPDNMTVPNAEAHLRNSSAGYDQVVKTDDTGAFRFNNVPPNMYELAITAPGFELKKEQVEVRGSAPINLDIALKMSPVSFSVAVAVTATPALIDTDPSAHTDADSSAFSKLPSVAGGGLSSIINNSTGGTAADANGFFHPLGDHAQVSFIIDGQPISDQQSKVFSTQLPANALQSMELITGAPGAEYGDKSSLVVNASTVSALGAAQPFGSVEAQRRVVRDLRRKCHVGVWDAEVREFYRAEYSVRTGHFLDTPEFLPIHDIGDNENVFDRMDYHPDGRTAFQLNLFTARNWFQVPNDYDQLSQDQKQRVLTWNVAPSVQHTFGSSTLLTINPFARRDQVNYYPSGDPFNDTPVTESQNRFLTNWGSKADLSTVHKKHSFKFGVQLQQTRLEENFALGVTSPAFNPVCLAPRRRGAGAPRSHQSRRVQHDQRRLLCESEAAAGPGALRPDARRLDV